MTLLFPVVLLVLVALSAGALLVRPLRAQPVPVRIPSDQAKAAPGPRR